ncbi:MAG: beta-galactosidase [Candidatus Sumerlaeota bacterium]|nr:beta-galactosidase [Candidatus Sumerlaeota bacterium]
MKSALLFSIFATWFIATAFAAEPKPLEAADLAQNGGFESPGRKNLPLGWTPSKTKQTGVEFVWDAQQPHSGARCIGIVSAYKEKTPWFWWDLKIEKMAPGEKRRLSGWARCEGKPYAAHLALRFLNAKGDVVESGEISLSGVGPKWVLVKKDLTAPPGTASAVIRLAMHGEGSVWLDDVKLASAAGPETEPFSRSRVYPVMEKADGWAGTPMARVGKSVEVSDAEAIVMEREVSKGERDLSFSFGLRHDAHALHLLVNVTDDVIHPSEPYWQGDSVQFAIDTKYRRSTDGFGEGDYALGIGTAKEKPPVYIDYAPKDSALTVEDIHASFAKTADGYAIEAAIPWSGLGLGAPTHNQRLGFSLVVNDSDGGGRKWAEWTPGIVKAKRPADFGTLLLMRGETLGLSLDGPPAPVADTAPLQLTAWLVSVAKETQTAPLTLTLDDGADARTARRDAATSYGATQVPFVFEPGSLAPGAHRAAVSSGKLSSDWRFEILPVRAMAEETRKGLAQLEERVNTLRDLIAKGRDRKADMAFPDVTLATAELFGEWIPADLARGGYETLAQREVERLAPLVDKAIQEAEAILAQPDAHPPVQPPNAMEAKLREGGWFVGDRLMFPIGFNQMDPDHNDMLSRLGCNLSGASTGGAGRVFGKGPAPEDAPIEAARERIRAAAALGIRSDVSGKLGVPDWFVKDYPDVRKTKGHFMDFDIDCPEAVDLACKAQEEAARRLAAEPGVFAYHLWNEANYEEISKRGLARFRADMQARYGSIDKLNEAWGSDYQTFDQVKPVTRDPGQPAAYTDWCRWNEARVTAFIQALADAVHRGDPNAAAHVKIPNEITLQGAEGKRGQTQSVSRHYQGIDRWALSRFLDIQGSDTRPTMESKQYCIAYPLPFMSFAVVPPRHEGQHDLVVVAHGDGAEDAMVRRLDHGAAAVARRLRAQQSRRAAPRPRNRRLPGRGATRPVPVFGAVGHSRRRLSRHADRRLRRGRLAGRAAGVRDRRDAARRLQGLRRARRRRSAPRLPRRARGGRRTRRARSDDDPDRQGMLEFDASGNAHRESAGDPGRGDRGRRQPSIRESAGRGRNPTPRALHRAGWEDVEAGGVPDGGEGQTAPRLCRGVGQGAGESAHRDRRPAGALAQPPDRRAPRRRDHGQAVGRGSVRIGMIE